MIVAPWKSVDGERLPAFADIFRQNAVKNGLLTIELSEPEVDRIFELVGRHPGLEATADLEAQTLTFHDPDRHVYRFSIDAGAKDKLLQGLDDIAQTLAYAADIERFEGHHVLWLGTPRG